MDKEIPMKSLHRYIDVCLIDEYADKDYVDGYLLDLDSIPDHEKEVFLNEIMKSDSALRDLIHFHMQAYINERLPICELKDMEFQGLKVSRRTNGDTDIISEESL